MRAGVLIAVSVACSVLAQAASGPAFGPKRIPRPSHSPQTRGGSKANNLRYRAAIDWAERLYARNVPFPDGYWGMEGTLDAFRRIKRRFPSGDRALIDLGRCYMAYGDYRQAADTFWQIRRRAAGLFTEASRRAKLASELGSRLPGKMCLQIDRIPGRPGVWIGLLGTNLRDEAYQRPLVVRPFLQFFSARRGRPLLLGAVRPIQVPRDDGARTATLLVTRLGQGYGAVVYQTFTAGDSDPNSQDVFRFTGHGIVHVGRFKGIEDARVFLATKRHGLRLKVFATWKVGWPDVYEWRRGAFRFANRLNPDLYKSDLGPYTSPDDYYPVWGDRAALADILGNFQLGAKLWRREEALCLLAIRSGHAWTPYGRSNRGELAEIRQRLGWIGRKQYDHWLLYRPYDADLFVPPYELGNAYNHDF